VVVPWKILLREVPVLKGGGSVAVSTEIETTGQPQSGSILPAFATVKPTSTKNRPHRGAPAGPFLIKR
jgi:hypothetical protein